MNRYTTTLTALTLLGLSLSSPPAALADEDDDYVLEEARHIELMDNYLEVSERFVSLAASPAASVYFAIEEIIELYEERGETRAAITHLQQLLKKYGDERTVRVLI